MFVPFDRTGNIKEDDRLFLESASSFVIAKGDFLAMVGTLANLSAYLWWYLEDVNWVGFYLYDGESLRLGPFQGEPACEEIRIGRGVCGTAAERRESIIVPDVEKFPGHIACSSASRSELVVPIVDEDGVLFGLIDVDSPLIDRFTSRERELLEALASMILA